MKELSKETKDYLDYNGIYYRYNENTDKFELHYPTDNFDYCDTEYEVMQCAKEYVEFWDNQH